MVASGLVASSKGEKSDESLGDTPLERLQLVPRWWRRLERIRLSLTG